MRCVPHFLGVSSHNANALVIGLIMGRGRQGGVLLAESNTVVRIHRAINPQAAQYP